MNKQNVPIYLPALGIINSLGQDRQEILEHLLAGDTSGLVDKEGLVKGRKVKVGVVKAVLPEIPGPLSEKYNTRSNKLILAAYAQIEKEVAAAVKKYGADRVGVILGTGTSGLAEAELAFEKYLATKKFPAKYRYDMQEMGSPAEFLAEHIGTKSFAYAVSTACSSSAKAFASARNLLALNLCDAVIVGGGDSLCKLTLNGFSALEAVSPEKCNPFSKNRKGINIGEGAALFLLTKEPSEIKLLGVGESSDANHITAPHPQGEGAASAMRLALKDAGLKPEDIDYVSLHGTATPANDKMESIAINTVFKNNVPCSSTKALTGHTLGAAGATEIGFCWLLLSSLNKDKRLAPQAWDKEKDPELMELNLVDADAPVKASRLKTCLSSSFAFGGNNACVIIGKNND